MKYLLFIALGGAGGALARYGISQWIHAAAQGVWPWGTLLVNVTGSALMGVVYVLLERMAIHPDWRSVLSVGFLGAFTTFSTFSLESVLLWQNGQVGAAVLYAGTSTLGCILALAAAMQLTHAVTG